MSTVQTSFSPPYLKDQTAFRESLSKLSKAESLSVDADGYLVPSEIFKDTFSEQFTSHNPRLVELKIMELLVHGKDWLEPADYAHIQQIAAKAGLFLDNRISVREHKELASLIHLIAKETLQGEKISVDDCEKLFNTFQNQYSDLLQPTTKQSKQVTKNLQNYFLPKNLEAKEEIFKQEAVILESTPPPAILIEKLPDVHPRIVPPRKKITHQAENKKWITQIALGTLAAAATVGGLYTLYHSFSSGIQKIAEPVDTIPTAIWVMTGICTTVGLALFHKVRKVIDEPEKLDLLNLNSDENEIQLNKTEENKEEKILYKIEKELKQIVETEKEVEKIENQTKELERQTEEMVRVRLEAERKREEERIAAQNKENEEILDTFFTSVDAEQARKEEERLAIEKRKESLNENQSGIHNTIIYTRKEHKVDIPSQVHIKTSSKKKSQNEIVVNNFNKSNGICSHNNKNKSSSFIKLKNYKKLPDSPPRYFFVKKEYEQSNSMIQNDLSESPMSQITRKSLIEQYQTEEQTFNLDKNLNYIYDIVDINIDFDEKEENQDPKIDIFKSIV